MAMLELINNTRSDYKISFVTEFIDKINPIAAINAMAMLLEHSGQPQAGARIDQAVAAVTGTKMKSQAAGRMGFGTSEVGDLVVEALG